MYRFKNFSNGRELTTYLNDYNIPMEKIVHINKDGREYNLIYQE